MELSIRVTTNSFWQASNKF